MNKGILVLTGAFISIAVIILLFIGNLNQPKITSKQENLNVTAGTEKASVPLPRQEDVINVFFRLIDEDRVIQAVDMLTANNIADEGAKQAWGVQFDAIDSITVKKIEPAGEKTFKVTLDVLMKPGAETAVPMPYYGWGDGEATRWVSLEENGDSFKISEIATGP